MFSAPRGGYLIEREYATAWAAARKTALTAQQAASPLAKRPYDLRHAGVSLWLRSGVDATEVARRAGHTVDVLLRVYAGVLHGIEDEANQRIERELTAAEDPPGPSEQRRPDTDSGPDRDPGE
jgi:integrase